MDQRTTDHGLPTRAILVICCIAQFMVVLDVVIVNVALPQMRDSLSLSVAGQQWVVNAYTLTFAGFLMLGGRAADLFGRRRVFMIGLAVFTICSLIGGLAQSGSWLIVARAAQGIGGAILAPATLSILVTTFTDPSDRRRALGAWSATASSGAAVGVLAGGLLTSLLNWRWVLFINVPIGIVLMIEAWVALPRHESSVPEVARHSWSGHRHGRPSCPGLRHREYQRVPLGIGQDHRYSRHRLGSAGHLLRERGPLCPGSAHPSRHLPSALLVGGQRNRRHHRRGALRDLFLPLSLPPGRQRLFRSANRPRLLAGGSLHADWRTRRRVLVQIIGARRQFGLGPGLAAVGLFWLSAIRAGDSYLSHVLGPAILIGIGIGMSFVPMTLSATAGVPPHEAGLASGLIIATRQVGGALGLAIMATVAATIAANQLGSADHVVTALTDGCRAAFAIAGGGLVIGALLALALPTQPFVTARIGGRSEEGGESQVALKADSREQMGV